MKKILLAVLLLIGVLIVIFLSPSVLRPTLTHETKVTIGKPLEGVWDKFSDPGNMGKWLDGFKSIETISGEPETVGSRHRIVIEKDGRRFEAIETVKEFVPQKRVAFELDGDIMTNDVIITVDGRGNATEIIQAETIKPKGFLYKAMMYRMQSSMQEQSETNLTNLKKFIEKG